VSIIPVLKKIKMADASNSKIQSVQKEVDEVVGIMNDNINKVMERGEKLDSLQEKTDDLQQSSLQFKRGATRVRKQMWFKNVKLNIAIAVVVIIILLIIILPIALSNN
jgi:vesicle-associated membrane protein 4